MATPAFDDRIVKVVFTYGETQVTIDTSTGDPKKPASIAANGTMYVNPLQNECNLSIANLSADLRNQLLTQLTPWNFDQKRKTVALYAGRVSTGMFLLYQGDITECFATQPPDIYLNIKSKTNQFYKYDIIAQAQNITAPLSNIVNNAAAGMGLNARFEATDKQIANYSYTGSRIKEIDHISELGPYDVYTTGSLLVCKDAGVPLKNENHTISAATGMISTPQPTEWGVKVVTMLNPSIIIGGGFTLDSAVNPLLNGDYTIYKYGFQIATTDVPFYSILEGTKRYDLYTNTALPQA
jgi:hypothetical protein